MNQYDAPPPQEYDYGPQRRYEFLRYRSPLRKWANCIGVGVLSVQVVMLLFYYALNGIFSFPVFLDVSLDKWDLIDQSISLVTYILAFWIPTLFITARIGIPARLAFPLKRPRASILIPAVFVCLGLSVLGMLAAGILSAVMQSVFGLTPTMPDFAIPVGTGANAVHVVSMTLAPAIFEELMFRGVILQSLRRFGDGFALVVSAILFGMIHGNLIQGPNAFLYGLAAGYFVLRTGSLLTSMLIHFINNGLSVLFSYLLDYLSGAHAELLNTSVTFAYALLGFGALIFLLVRHDGIFRVAPSEYPLTAVKKFTAFFTSAAQVIFLIFTVLMICIAFE